MGTGQPTEKLKSNQKFISVDYTGSSEAQGKGKEKVPPSSQSLVPTHSPPASTNTGGNGNVSGNAGRPAAVNPVQNELQRIDQEKQQNLMGHVVWAGNVALEEVRDGRTGSMARQADISLSENDWASLQGRLAEKNSA